MDEGGDSEGSIEFEFNVEVEELIDVLEEEGRGGDDEGRNVDEGCPMISVSTGDG